MSVSLAVPIVNNALTVTVLVFHHEVRFVKGIMKSLNIETHQNYMIGLHVTVLLLKKMFFVSHLITLTVILLL